VGLEVIQAEVNPNHLKTSADIFITNWQTSTSNKPTGNPIEKFGRLLKQWSHTALRHLFMQMRASELFLILKIGWSGTFLLLHRCNKKVLHRCNKKPGEKRLK
jgi:hypothetical protein